MRYLKLAALAIAASFALAVLPTTAAAQDDEEQPRRETRRAEALSKGVYDELTKAQEAIDADDLNTAARIVDQLLADELSDFERGNVLNFKGFLEYSRGNNNAAIRAYEQMIAIPNMEPGQINQTIYTLAQLYAQQENFSKTIEYLNRWFQTATNPAPDPYILLAQAYAQTEQFNRMISPIDSAIAEARERDIAPKEEWYNLKYYACYQLQQFNCVRDTLKILAAGWPKKTYWLQLAGIYSELEDEKNMLAVYEAAYTDNLLTTEGEIVTMAQLYLQGDVPFKAAKVLEAGMEAGTVSRNTKNYRLLSQAWQLAKDDEKSIPPLREAARLSDDGDLGAGLAIAYLNTEAYSDCVSAGRDALQKGGLRQPNDVRVTIGMCLYNQDRLTDSRTEFQRIVNGSSDRSKSLARQWIRVINADLERLDALRQARQRLREQREEAQQDSAEEAAPEAETAASVTS
ncbi:MAG: hypothetical protein AAFN07_10670 [Pseudomonadota bacterium]